MPWRERTVIEERQEFARLVSMPGANMSELCRRFEISRDTGYKWKKRYGLEGAAGLCDRSRRPLRSPTRSEGAIEAEVLRIRAESNNAWGGRKIAKRLRDAGWLKVPALSTVTEILRRNGKLEERAGEHPGPYQRFERQAPNELWQMDFKGHFPIARGRCHPLTMLDDHSRYALAVEACDDEQDVTVRERMTAVFRRYGLPEAILTDNGAPWGDGGNQSFTGLSVWLMRLGVRVVHGRPYHPQTQGKDERFHRTLKAEVLSGYSFADLAQCQAAFDWWRPRYNHHRPHQALDLAVPASRYRPSSRSFSQELPAIEYQAGDIVRKVSNEGFISYRAQLWRIGKAFRAQSVALRPTEEDGVLKAYFCSETIATIDLHGSVAYGVAGRGRARPATPQAPHRQPAT